MKKIQIKIAQFPNPNKTFNLKYGFGAYVANNVIETYLDKKLNFIIKHNLSNLSDEQIDNKIISVFEHHVDNLIYNGNNIFEDITTLKVLDSIFHLK
ncbi:hypothetical protein FACS1894166_11160 [Bacilli bacterium]|nr:hypothetical protein FACS1894166_11160 [Bacilli bacterium]